MAKKKEKTVIGTTDKIDLIDLDVLDLPCKIDTGANTSSLHCEKVKLVRENEVEVVSFRLLDPSHPAYNGKEYRVKEFKERKIINSFGHWEYRFVIKTKVKLFDQEFTTEFTLSNRGRMKYPVLLGKKLLKGRFLVDVSKSNLSYKNKNSEIESNEGSDIIKK